MLVPDHSSTSFLPRAQQVEEKECNLGKWSNNVQIQLSKKLKFPQGYLLLLSLHNLNSYNVEMEYRSLAKKEYWKTFIEKGCPISPGL